MKKKKQALVGLGVVCVLLASFALVYAAWTPEQMANYMFNIGRHKIYQTNWILYNEIGPKMGQGLVGEWEKGSFETVINDIDSWFYTAPDDNPKKVTFWIELDEMRNGDHIKVIVLYDVNPDDALPGRFFYPALDTASRKFEWEFENSQDRAAVMIADELPVATSLWIYVEQTSGTPFTISYQAVIEEM